jgi:exonuclease SbcD
LPVKNIHLIGTIPRTKEGLPDYAELLIPLHTRSGTQKAWCLAVPFLRQGDTPPLPVGVTGYAASVEAFYKEAMEVLEPKILPDQAVLAMGHMHVSQAAVSDMDTSERAIIGGMDGIPQTAFPEKLCYVALGHIHKAQALGPRKHIQYSGSPLPMSFSEKNYRHKVVLLEISNAGLSSLEHLEIPILTPVLTLPEKPLPIDEVLEILSGLDSSGDKSSPAPYLEVLVLEDHPDPARKKKIQDALEGKHARLTKITPVAASEADKRTAPGAAFGEFKALKPEELFRMIYQKQFGNEVPDDLLKLFREAESDSSKTD